MQTFEDWLEERYPHHNGFDFDCLANYQHWIWMNRVAYIAGWNACRDKWGGMSYVDTLNDSEEKAKIWFKTSAMNWGD